RVMPDAVLLPDGTVFVANGSATGIADHGPSPVYEGELYDPRRPERGWQLTAPMSFPRLYHATALLLPDATVMTAGTDATWNPAPYAQTGHRIEIYSPPYLFAGPRPVIERVESASEPCAHGAVLTVRSPDAGRIDEVVIVRASSVTHSTNTDQRLVELDFKQGDAATLEVTLPSGRGVAPPGIYLLFVLADGVPSEGRFLQLGGNRWLDLAAESQLDLLLLDAPFSLGAAAGNPAASLMLQVGNVLPDAAVSVRRYVTSDSRPLNHDEAVVRLDPGDVLSYELRQAYWASTVVNVRFSIGAVDASWTRTVVVTVVFARGNRIRLEYSVEPV
ncbi:MAG TPA: galactose oxidase early set domain-containing protein, partial [Nocardioidaceae bacterium]|nr:galactose oxidase early set domain-containing protein [Nocardioidaceae bacterium]